jgi:hypothetical protein
MTAYLIWSNEHRRWWRAGESGYTSFIEEAGRYDKATAEYIVQKATVGGRLAEPRTDPVTGRPYSWLSEHMVPAPETTIRPPVVTLCGSTRFHGDFGRINYEMTMCGWIVLSVGFYWNAPEQHGEDVGLPTTAAERERVKQTLDDLHMRKIDMSEMIVVINRDGYIGESTAREVQYAKAHGKQIRYAFPERKATVRYHQFSNDGAGCCSVCEGTLDECLASQADPAETSC